MMEGRGAMEIKPRQCRPVLRLHPLETPEDRKQGGVGGTERAENSCTDVLPACRFNSLIY